MTDLLMWLDTVGRDWAIWLLWMNLWTGAILVVAIMLDRLLEGRVSARWRLMPFVTVLARLALPMAWASPLAFNAVGVPPAVATLAPQTLPMLPTSSIGSWWSIVPVIYIAVALALALHWFRLRRRAVRVLARSMPAPPEVASESADVRISVVPDSERCCAAPAVVGTLRPRLLLPVALLDPGLDAVRRLIIAHEQAHVRRGDHWFVFGLQWLQIVFWPIVPLWVAAARIRELMELACDESALRGADASTRRMYARTLLDGSRSRRLVSVLSWRGASTMGRGASTTFGSRLRAIAMPDQPTWNAAAQAIAVLVAGVLLLTISTTNLSLTARPVAVDVIPAREKTADRRGLGVLYPDSTVLTSSERSTPDRE